MMYDGLFEKVESFLEEKGLSGEYETHFVLDNKKMDIYFSPEENIAIIDFNISDIEDDLNPKGFSQDYSIDLIRGNYRVVDADYNDNLFITVSKKYGSSGDLKNIYANVSLPHSFDEPWGNGDSYEQRNATFDGKNLNVGPLTNARKEPVKPDKQFAELDILGGPELLTIKATRTDFLDSVDHTVSYNYQDLTLEEMIDSVFEQFKDA